ncbi:MAG TPA: rhodanese-like domain-containing protein [Flavipsychrobacter sp.]|nr:rhodanese-like domain-containing protein [Flavipsychrobacter sp.]
MKSLSPAELKAWMDNKMPFVLIDVREDWEREVYNIGGEHIPLGDVIARRDEIPVDKPVVVYCEKGIRSSIIIQRLEGIGFNNLYNLSGGMSNWKKANLS